MANSVFQNVILQLKEITEHTFGVIDSEGYVVSCTDVSLLGECWQDAARRVANAGDGIFTFGQRTFKAIVSGSNYFEYAVFCSGTDDSARTCCAMAYIALNDAKVFYEEKHDRGTFVKNIILDNILPGDIYVRAKELHFATDAPRVVFLVRQNGHADVATVDVLSNLFPDRGQDFVLSVNESDVAVIKQITYFTTPEELEKIAQSIETTLKNELYVRPVIGYGTDTLPAFYTRESDFGVDYRIDTPEELAAAFKAGIEMGMKSGMLVTNPIPEQYAMPKAVIDAAINQAISECEANGIKGKETTPFLLARVAELTGGDSLASNIQLVFNNAKVAAQTAAAYCKL